MKLTKDIQRTAAEGGRQHESDSDVDKMKPVFRFSAVSGCAGFLLGGTMGILRGANPVAAGLAASAQYAILGLSFSGLRAGIISTQNVADPSPGSLTYASAVAGGVAGAHTGFVFRGPRSILPGGICYAALGAGGQMLVNAYNRDRSQDTPSKPVLSKIAQSSWSPITSLSNEDYAKLLKEKLLKVEVEIAIIDDKIAALQLEEAAAKTDGDAK